jgi:hypothetical protein
MEFFDRKEEVLDVQLTQYGKYLLSVGKLKPAYYAFFDDDVDYDTNYQGDPPGPGNSPGPNENQKDTEDRIKETPRIKVVHSVDSVEKSVNQVESDPAQVTNVIGWADGGGVVALGVSEGFDPTETSSGNDGGNLGPGSVGGVVVGNPPLKFSDFLSPTFGDIPYKYPIPKKQNTAGLQIPLGTSDYNSIYYPAFDLNFSKGEITNSFYYDSGSFGIKRIPQIEVEVQFETTIGETGQKGKVLPISEILSVKGSDEAVDFDYSFISEDGTFVKIEEDYISIDLKELNSLSEKEDFFVEVYEIENPDTENEILLPLRFGGDYFSDLYYQFLYDKTSNILKASEDFVEHYFKISMDSEIQTPTKPLGEAAQLPENNFDLCEDEDEI